jgi:hypothetical protein
MSKQTAVEFLEEKYRPKGYITAEEFEQAKEMEKQQMKEKYIKGIENYDPTFKKK